MTCQLVQIGLHHLPSCLQKSEMKGWTSFERRQSFKIWHNIQTCMYTMTLDCIFAFRLSKVKKAGELGMAQYQFLILDHGLYRVIYITIYITI
jgi:hypothetical protein